MLRKLSFLAALVAALSASVAHADVWISGNADTNATGVGPLRADTKQINLAGGGASYNNVAGANGLGATINAIGFVPLSSATNLSNSTSPYPLTSGSAETRFVVVYALQGTIANPNPATATADFNNAKGFIGIFDRGTNAPAINAQDPNTWVQNIGTLAGLLTGTEMATRPTAVAQGPGIDPSPAGVNINAAGLNFATIDLTGAVAGARVDLKVDLLNTQPGGGPFGTFFADWQPLAAGDTPSLIGRVEQLLDRSLNPNVSFLDTLFNTLTAGTGVVGTFSTGGYTPGAADFLSGDAPLQNTGGFVWPGVQRAETEVPEPASLLVWSVIAAGAGVGMVRRRRQSA